MQNRLQNHLDHCSLSLIGLAVDCMKQQNRQVFFRLPWSQPSVEGGESKYYCIRSLVSLCFFNFCFPLGTSFVWFVIFVKLFLHPRKIRFLKRRRKCRSLSISGHIDSLRDFVWCFAQSGEYYCPYRSHPHWFGSLHEQPASSRLPWRTCRRWRLDNIAFFMFFCSFFLFVFLGTPSLDISSVKVFFTARSDDV